MTYVKHTAKSNAHTLGSTVMRCLLAFHPNPKNPCTVLTSLYSFLSWWAINIKWMTTVTGWKNLLFPSDFGNLSQVWHCHLSESLNPQKLSWQSSKQNYANQHCLFADLEFPLQKEHQEDPIATNIPASMRMTSLGRLERLRHDCVYREIWEQEKWQEIIGMRRNSVWWLLASPQWDFIH